MGVEQSHTVSPTLPPTVLDSRDLKSVAKFILSGECQKIVFLVCLLCSLSCFHIHELDVCAFVRASVLMSMRMLF